MASIAAGAASLIGSAITAASGAAASATLALTGSAAAAAFAGNAVLGLASWQTAFTVAGFAASALLTPQVNIEGSPTDWRAEPNAGIPFVMGERATSGIIVHRDAYGLDNRLQSIVTVYSGAGPVEGLDQFYADDVAMSFDANGEATNGGNFAGNMWLYTTPGDQPQSAALANDSVLNSQIGSNAFEGWLSTSKISGKAHSLLTLRQDSKLKTYAGGIPRTRFKMRGIKMYDPRLDSTVAGGSGSHRVVDQSTYAYSENPAIAALNWCLGLKENGVVVGGIGASVDGIDLPAFIEWANVCDANGWTVSAVPTSADDKHQVLLAIMQAGGARYSRFQGKMSCIVRTPRTSVVTLSADDTAGPFEVDLNADRLTRTNTITPRCVMESHAWEMVAQEPVSESSYVTADGGERARGVDYPFVAIKATNANKDQPSQLAAYAIVDSRETIAGTVPLKPWGAQIEPGDVFTITEPGFLLDGVELLCLRREFDLAENIVLISFISESAGKHTYALGLDPTPPTAPGLTAPDIYTVDPPGVGVWSVAAGTGNQPTATVSGSADQLSAQAFIVEYRTQDDPDTGSPWVSADAGWVRYGQFDISTTDVTITGLEPNTAYEIAVSYISQFGVIGDRRNLGAITTGAMVADEAETANTISGKTREAIERAEAEAIRAAKEAAEALIFEATDRYYKVRANRKEARNLFELERTERIAADEAEATTRETQISAVGDSVALVETEVTTLATNLSAETNTRTTQISAVNNAIAAVETEVETVASDLSAETSARQTQVSAVEDNVATLTTQYNTLATDVSAQSTSLTNLTATVNDQGTDLTALSSDFATAQADIDTLFAARIIRVSAGAAEASIKLFAENSGGTEASKINITGQTVTFGPDDQVEFRSDGLFTIRGTNGDNALRFSPNLRKLEIWNPDGTVQFDSSDGGVQTPGVKAGALTRQWIARDGPTNWYITTTRKKLVSFDVTADSAEAALQIDAAVAVFNDHASDVHTEVVIEVNSGSNGSHAEQTIIGFDVTEAARCGLTTGTLGTGTHTIDVWVRHYGSRAGSVGGTEVRAASYEIRASMIERTAVTTLTNATQSSSGGGSPGGTYTPPPGGGVLP